MRTPTQKKKWPMGSPILRSYLKRGERFTTEIDIAISIAEEVRDKAPIEFISPNLRETYLKAQPELGRIPELT